MKNKIILFSYALAFTVAISSCKPTKTKPDENPSVVTYEPGVTIPDYEKLSLNTYQTAENAKTDEETARKNVVGLLEYAGAAKEFDLKDGMKENDMIWYRNPKDPSAILNVNLANGDISLNRGMLAYSGNNSTPDLIKQVDAVRVATDHIQKLGFGKNDENSMKVGHVGGVNMAIHDDKDGDKVYEKLTTVRFDRVLDNIPVIGHTRLLVQMGSKGMVQSLVKQWAPLANTAIANDSEVNKDEVKKSIETHLTNENKTATKIIVKKIDLIYYDTGKGIIEPALHIIGEIQVPKSQTDSTLVSFKHDMVEPILKSPRLSYTFMGEDHISPKVSDAINPDEQIQRGEDELHR